MDNLIIWILFFGIPAVLIVKMMFRKPVKKISKLTGGIIKSGKGGKITGCFSQGNVPDGYTPIYDAYDLRAMNDVPAGKYCLMNDIDVLVGMDESEPKYNFAGIFDGNGHTITIKEKK